MFLYILCRSTILVRRGWVPRDKKDQETRLEGLTEGEVTVEGLLRSGEQKASSFVPENNPEKNEWYSLDVEEMAKQSGAQPVVIEMILGKGGERVHKGKKDYVDLESRILCQVLFGLRKLTLCAFLFAG